MRNLITSHRGSLVVQSQDVPDLPLAVASFDPITDSIVCAFGPSDEFKSIEIQQHFKDGSMNVFASWEVLTIEDASISIKSIKYFAESNSLVVILSNGDIINVIKESEEATIEIIGSIDDTIEDCQWSPDEEILAIATTKSLIFLSRLFESISETQITLQDLSLQQFVSAGWGKAETQFQGKGAKAKGLRDPTLPTKVDLGHICPNDTLGRTLSWRGDGEYIALSSVDVTESLSRRTIRVFERSGVLNSISTPVDTLESHLAWRPSGNVVASVQRVSSDKDHVGPDLVFFERNGLRRYEFSLRQTPDEPILDITWNVESDVLAVLLKDRVQLWTTKNYHWYLKQEIVSRQGDTYNPTKITWHPEKPLALMIIYSNSINPNDTHIEIHQFVWSFINGSTVAPHDYGTTAVVDGTEIKLTPLAISNTPPPLGFRSIFTSKTPVHVAVSQTSSSVAILGDSVLEIAEWNLSTKPIKAPKITKTIAYGSIGIDGSPKQIAFVEDKYAVGLFDSPSGSGLVVFDLTSGKIVEMHQTLLDVITLKSRIDYQSVIFQTIDGTVCQLRLVDNFEQIDTILTLPQRCDYVEACVKDEEVLVYSLASNGRLFANERQIASSATSLKLTQSHATFTTAQNYLKFCHVTSNIERIVIPSDDVVNDERCRAIETGSLIVAVMPSKTGLVLQAPRGNLETIYPRIMVLNHVRNNIDAKRYDLAFAACRIHRVDLNILHDYNPQQFRQNVQLFINQLATIEYLDLFLSGLKKEDVSITMYKQTLENDYEGEKKSSDLSSKVNNICDGILSILLTPQYKTKYTQSVLTAYACKTPPDLESALSLIGQDLKSGNTSQVEFSVQHLCFLQDVELLYTTSLGLYDLDLTLVVAQHSQKDPKEYLPFLQDLNSQEFLRRKFNIDTHLKRYTKALDHLVEIASSKEDAFNELLDYVVDHQLYQDALRILKHSVNRQNSVLGLYASYLHGKTSYTEAAVIYESLGKYEEALDAYELAGDWRQALSIVINNDQFKDRKDDMVRRLVGHTMESKEFLDCATIYLDYLNDVPEALRAYCKGFYFGEAIRVATLRSRIDLLEPIIDAGLLEGFSQTSELLSDCKSQVKSQVNRIRELRVKKVDDPLSFFGGNEETDAPDNVSLAPTESSTAPSFFTRYTGKTGGTAQTGATRRTAKNKRREERKRARGKKGSVYEEEYLINSIGRLIERLDITRPEAVRLIEGLVRRGMREHAYQVQKSFVEITRELSGVVEEVYSMTEKDRERYDDDGKVFYIPLKPVPVITPFPRMQSLNY